MNNLLENLRRNAQTQPDSLAIWSDSSQLTFSELYQAVALTAAWLIEEVKNQAKATASTLDQTQPASIRVGVLGTRSVNSIIGIYACIWSGCTYIPLSSRLPAERLNSFVGRADLHALLIADNHADYDALKHIPDETLAVSSITDYLFQQIRDSALAKLNPTLHPSTVELNDLAYILFTSGTTGTPKGVMITNSNVRSYLDNIIPVYGLTSEDKISQFYELTFDAALSEIYLNVVAGACLYLIPEKHKVGPGAFIVEKEITVFFSVPSNLDMMDKLKQLKPDSFPTVKFSTFGGEPLPLHMIEKWRIAAPNTSIENLYGPTETTVACMRHQCNENAEQTDDRNWASIGTPYLTMKAGCVDSDLAFVPVGEKGQIVLHGPQVAPGYWKDTKNSAAQFISLDHPQHGRGIWYLTGDYGYQDVNKNFHFLGRMDNQVKIRGHRVELEDIESHLIAISQSKYATCISRPADNGSDSRIIAFIDTQHRCKSEIISELAKRVPNYMIPDEFYSIKNVPLTVNGKLDKQFLISQINKGIMQAIE